MGYLPLKKKEPKIQQEAWMPVAIASCTPYIHFRGHYTMSTLETGQSRLLGTKLNHLFADSFYELHSAYNGPCFPSLYSLGSDRSGP